MKINSLKHHMKEAESLEKVKHTSLLSVSLRLDAVLTSKRLATKYYVLFNWIYFKFPEKWLGSEKRCYPLNYCMMYLLFNIHLVQANASSIQSYSKDKGIGLIVPILLEDTVYNWVPTVHRSCKNMSQWIIIINEFILTCK